MKKNKIITFDLDGTLIQSSQFMNIPDYDFTVSVYWHLGKSPEGVKVKVRPGAVELLQKLSQKYIITIFSHSFEDYIIEVLEKMQVLKIISAIFSNEDENAFGKDLRLVLKKLGFNSLSDIIIIDDNSWTSFTDNLLLIPAYRGLPKDELFNEQFIKKIEDKFESIKK